MLHEQRRVLHPPCNAAMKHQVPTFKKEHIVLSIIPRTPMIHNSKAVAA